VCVCVCVCVCGCVCRSLSLSLSLCLYVHRAHGRIWSCCELGYTVIPQAAASSRLSSRLHMSICFCRRYFCFHAGSACNSIIRNSREEIRGPTGLSLVRGLVCGLLRLGNRYLSPLSRVGDVFGGPLRLETRDFAFARRSRICEGVTFSRKNREESLRLRQSRR
jgi:hypothetical protein